MMTIPSNIDASSGGVVHAVMRRARPDFVLDVTIRTGRGTVGVFGPSGSGKSTIINLIAGLERPDHGVIAVNGRTLFDHARGVDVPAHRRGIGVVFQEHRLFPHLSVEGNLNFGRRSSGNRHAADGSFRQIIDLLELGGLLQRRVTDLSGGERQRVALGRALVSGPQLLLLDEPLSSLDQKLKQQIIPFFQRIRDESGVPMMYVSHDLGEILQLTDELIVLDRGTIVGHGRYADLVHQDAALRVVHAGGMRNVVSARVLRHVPDEGISVLQLGDPDDAMRELVAPKCDVEPGSRVTFTVYPWDIALAAAPVHPVSIQNQIHGVVARCTVHERSAIVEVQIGVPLIVEVSRRSAAALQLSAGRPIVCLIKSHAVRFVSLD